MEERLLLVRKRGWDRRKRVEEGVVLRSWYGNKWPTSWIRWSLRERRFQRQQKKLGLGSYYIADSELVLMLIDSIARKLSKVGTRCLHKHKEETISGNGCGE